MDWKTCARCGARLSLGKSNDRIPADEKHLARCIADAVLLFEPGAERDKWIGEAIAACGGQS